VPNRRAALVLRPVNEQAWGDRVAASASPIGAIARRGDTGD
jgi:hypothetical protein